MNTNEQDIKQATVTDDVVKTGLVADNQSGELVRRAHEVLEATIPTEDLPVLTDVAKSNEEWEKKYGSFEEKKASLPKVTEVEGHKVIQEIKREHFYRYSPAVTKAKHFGYPTTEIRIFQVEGGLFCVTDLEGRDIKGHKDAGKSKQDIIIDKLDRIIELLQEAQVLKDSLAVTNEEMSTKVTEPQVKDIFSQFLGANPADSVRNLPKSLPTTHKVPPTIPYSPSSVVTEKEQPKEDPKQEYFSESKSTEEAIVKAYEWGEATTDIREQYNISAGTLYAILNRHGVKLRRTGSPKGLAGTQVEEYIEDESKRKQLIHAYTANKMTLAEIYSAFGITKNGMFFILDRYGVPRRMPKRMQNVMDDE